MIRVARSGAAYFAFLLLALWPSMSRAQSNSQTGPSAQTDLFVGNWRYVPEESRLIETVPKDITFKLKFVSENGHVREELEFALQSENNGRPQLRASILQFDGQEHPLEAAGETKHSKHTILWKRIDDHTIESRINHDDGKEYTTDRLGISPDGRKLTMTRRVQRSDGTQSEGIVTFVRQ